MTKLRKESFPFTSQGMDLARKATQRNRETIANRRLNQNFQQSEEITNANRAAQVQKAFPAGGGFNNTGAGGGANAAGSTFVGGQGRNSHTPIFGSAPQPFYISNQPRCPVPGATDRFAGGGGGGTIDTNCRNGNGGSGVVLIAYKTAAA